MGFTFIDGVAKGPTGQTVGVKFLMDSGATYSLLSIEQWKAIDLKPLRRMAFTLADGTTIERDISECHISLPQGEGHTAVILGEDGDEPLIGIVTLEILGLTLNPFNRTLQPMKGLLV